jgi:tagatose-1,6-bisphosphate aldolase
MLEPLSYSLTDQNLSSTEKRYVVVETARRLTAIPGVDLFKAEFPLDIADDSEWAAACADVSTASSVPWILLSGAASFSTYLRQVATACQAGASGIAVGRAVWQEAVHMQATERSAFLLKTARSRLARLSALCQALARPWMDYFAADAPLGWYKTY